MSPALTSFAMHLWVELLSLLTDSAILSSVVHWFFVTSRKTWRSVGFRLYRQLRRSWHVASFRVRNWMLSMVDVSVAA